MRFPFNIMRHRQDGRHFQGDIFKWIFFNENCCVLIHISLKYVPKGPIDNNLALVQIMAWCQTGDKPLSEPMMAWFGDIYASLGLNEFSEIGNKSLAEPMMTKETYITLLRDEMLNPSIMRPVLSHHSAFWCSKTYWYQAISRHSNTDYIISMA